MALTSDEIDQCRYQTGYPLTRIGAEPYITFSAVFDKAIVPYLTDTVTSSASLVVAAASGAIATIVLASSAGFVQGSNVVVDLGVAQEFSILTTLTGSTTTLTLFNAHGQNGAYPVKLKGAEYVVRRILARIDTIETKMDTIAPTTAGVEAVNKIRISPSQRGRRSSKNMFESLASQRDDARDELASALGLPNLRRSAKSTGGGLTLY